MLRNNTQQIADKEYDLRQKIKKKDQKINEKQEIMSREEFKNFKEIISCLRKLSADLTQQRDQKQMEIERLDQELNKILGNQYADLVEQIKFLEEQKKNGAEEVSKSKSDIQLHTKQISTKTEKKRTGLEDIEKAQKDQEDCAKKINELVDCSEKLMQTTIEFEHKLDECESAKEEINKQNEGLLEEIQVLVKAKRETTVQLEILKERMEGSFSNLTTYREELKKNKTEYVAQKSFYELMDRIQSD